MKEEKNIIRGLAGIGIWLAICGLLVETVGYKHWLTWFAFSIPILAGITTQLIVSKWDKASQNGKDTSNNGLMKGEEDE